MVEDKDVKACCERVLKDEHKWTRTTDPHDVNVML
jgi:hypothetical protein